MIVYSNLKLYGSRQTRLEAEFSATVGTPPPFKDQGADAAPKAVGGEEIRPTNIVKDREFH